MGKNRHSKDRLFLTATEWKRDYGGKTGGSRAPGSRPLPFDHCALSLAQFTTPVLLGKESGVVFDFENIVPYVQKYKSDPVTGNPASTKDIIRLKMEKNSEGEWHCPITSKVFTNSSHIVAIATSGSVYAFDAVNELNLKSKNFTDLITGDSFKRSDIVTIQDPQNAEHCAKRDINNFTHLKKVREDGADARRAEGGLRPNLNTEKVLREIEAQREMERQSGQKRKTTEEVLANKADENGDDVIRFLNLHPTTDDVNPGQVISDGKASRSFTSTSLNRSTASTTRLATAEEIRDARWKIMRQLGKKGFVQLQTSLGNLNVEVHCDITPRTAWNFLTLCQRGYYNNMSVHRLVPGFMVQAGDPTGTGSGGSSAFGPVGKGIPFRDEFDTRVLHNARGVLSMANSGANTNGSQFYIIFKPTPHLDLKHAVFGRTVGGLACLDRIEQVGSDKKERPLSEIMINQVVVFSSPVDEADDALEAFIRTNMERRLSVGSRDSRNIAALETTKFSTGSSSSNSTSLPGVGGNSSSSSSFSSSSSSSFRRPIAPDNDSGVSSASKHRKIA